MSELPPGAAPTKWRFLQRGRLLAALSGTVLIGLVLNGLFGWAWADSIAALVVAGLAIREGIEAWRGDIESPFEVLEDLDHDDHEEVTP